MSLPSLQQRLQNALAAIGSDDDPKVQALHQLFDQAQSQTVDLLNGRTTSSPQHHILANIQSLLTNATLLPNQNGALVASSVTSEGDLVGTLKYESLDVEWTEAAICWLEHFPTAQKALFPKNPPPIMAMGSAVTIAIAGDWGTGISYRTDGQPSGAGKVKDEINNLHPDYTVHLGDVYYAGTQGEEQQNFLGLWPAGGQASFALNANHEMYSGAQGYFGKTLADPQFSAQKSNSYFALKNQDWLVIGLDTAYHADEINLYQNGNLDPGQCAYVTDLLNNAANQKVILLTHHNGLSTDGATTVDLWEQLAPLFAGREVWWYWGHLHAGIVYADRGTIHPRCCGHGAVPAGAPSGLNPNPAVLWYENNLAGDPTYTGRVKNGFVLLSLNESDLTEAFVNEDGMTVYPKP